MYSSICYNILSSTLTPRYAILLRLRPVFYCLGRKKTYKSKKKARCKVDLLCNALF